MHVLGNWQPELLSVLRIISGLLFLQHGTQKMLAFPTLPDMPPGPPEFLSLIWIAGLIELVGGVLLTLGLFTRIAAFICSGEMAVAYFYAHAPQGFLPIANGGDAAILYSFVFLYLAAAGPGPWSIDAAMLGEKRVPAA